MLTEPGKASASIAKSNKQQAGACLYQEKKIGEADDNISVLRFLFYQNFFQVSRRKRIRLGNPEVSGRTDQGKTGTYIV